MSERKKHWAEELGRDAVLTAFGLTADTFPSLVDRFARGGREEQEENGDEDLADEWAFAGGFDDVLGSFLVMFERVS